MSLPDKKYYKISEISDYLNITPSVLRFWEKKFPQLKVKKNKNNGHRRYTRKDLEVILKIYDLLYVKKFKIEGAIEILTSELKNDNPMKQSKVLLDKETIINDLMELKKLIIEDL